MTVATFSRSSFLQAHMKNRSYHSHHTSDHETGMCRYAGRQQAAGRAWKLATGNLVAELSSVEA